MSWSYCKMLEEREIEEGRAFSINISIEHLTKKKAFEYLQHIVDGIVNHGLQSLSEHPTRDWEEWEECLPEGHVSVRWIDFTPENSKVKK